MDPPFKNMFDTFKEEIWKELGPLDPDWFETLTALPVTNEGNVSDQDDLCPNQEGHFKTPFDKNAVDSQLASTPKVFRRCRVLSPGTEDEQSFTAEQETLPWTETQSPYLFWELKDSVQGVKHGGIQFCSQGSFNLHDTPQKSPVSYAKRISESLGADVHPDISWTSSLNTPPASTLILTKPDTSPHPASVSEEQNVVIVRKLFPSLSTASRAGLVSPPKNDATTVHQDVVACGGEEKAESPDSSLSSLNQSECVWKQKLPDAIEDGEVRNTVAGVLDGAEDVLSIFFTNSSTALRKVKTDRKKRKQIVPKKKRDCSGPDMSTANILPSSEQRLADQETERLSSPPPLKAEDSGTTQWSPLNLSDIPLSVVDTPCRDSAASQMENNPRTPKQLVRSQMKVPHSGFNSRKRKFVYSVEASKLQSQGEVTQSQKVESSSRILETGQDINLIESERAPDKADCCDILEKNTVLQKSHAEDNPEQAKLQELDISQLSRDFAQGFSQIPEPGHLGNEVKDTSRNGFSPSACLSAMKQAYQKARQASLHLDCDGVGNRSVSTTNPVNLINESTVLDSGFQSTVADNSHVTASSFTNLDNSGQPSYLKTTTHRTTASALINKGTGEAQLDGQLQEPRSDVSAVKGTKMVSLKESELLREGTSTRLPGGAKGTAGNGTRILGSLPEKTTTSFLPVLASGFKTASHKEIQISLANLAKARHLFEETGGEKSFVDQTVLKCTENKLEMCVGSVKTATSNSDRLLSSSEKIVNNGLQLTASQKADVTELCTILEEADSQFEFTQFKLAKPKQHCQDSGASPPEADKELDSDFLSGIDFDDSFNSDVGNKQAKSVINDDILINGNIHTCDKVTEDSAKASNIISKTTDSLLPNAVKKEKPPTENVPRHISDSRHTMVSAETQNGVDQTVMSKLENKDALMLGVGFKTAGGNVVRVSKKCLSKAKALFADLEDSLVANENLLTSSGNCDDKRERSVSSGRQMPDIKDGLENIKMGTTECQSGFQMASGKVITVSADAMQKADALFKDCNSINAHTTMSSKDKGCKEPSSENLSHKSDQKYQNVQGIKTKLPEEQNTNFENGTAKPPRQHLEVLDHHVSHDKFPPPLTHTTSKCRGSSAVNEVNTNRIVCTASGEKNMVSDDAPSKTDTFENTSEQLAKQISLSTSKNGGFQTASGKGVSVSSEALRKAKMLLNDCDEVTQTHAKKLASGPQSRNHGFLAASGKAVPFSSEALQKANALFSNTSVSAEIPPVSLISREHMKKRQCGFSSTAGAKVNVSQKRPWKAQNLLNEYSAGAQNADTALDCFSAASPKENPVVVEEPSLLCTTSNNTDCSLVGESSYGGGFNTDSGKKLYVSNEAMEEAKPQNATLEVINKELGEKYTVLPKNGGFQTASGKGVTISSAALKKAKILFSECEGVKDEFGVKASPFEKPVPGPAAAKDHGFAVASDKPLTFSEAHKETAAHFGNMASKSETPVVSNKSNSDCKEAVSDGEILHCGFTTAAGAKVHVSQKGLLKAKDLLNECNLGVKDANSYSKERDIMHGSTSEQQQSGPLKCSNATPLKENWALMEEPSSGGFNKASGKRVSVSEAATKAKLQLNSNATLEGRSDELKEKNIFPAQNVGFQTASGKGVAISSAALKKAQILFSECEGVTEEISVKTAPLKRPIPGPAAAKDHGFLAVSDKTVASVDGLKDSKALYGTTASKLEIPVVSNKRNSDYKEAVSDAEILHCGFTTAGGAKVHVSQKSLLKAKNLLNECNLGVKDADSYVKECDITDGSTLKKHKIRTREEIHLGNNGEIFKNTLNCSNQATLKENPTLMEEPSPLCTASKYIDCSTISESSYSGGFNTASGKRVSVSNEAVTKAKALLNSTATSEWTSIQLEDGGHTFPPQNGGFQTASGKGVAISSASLKKAQILFSECEGATEELSVKAAPFKKPVPGPAAINDHGFLAANDKPVAFSEALEDLNALNVSHSKHGDKQGTFHDSEKTHCGFTTAGGAKVHVSQKNLLKAKNLLKDLGDEDCYNSTRRSKSPHESDPLKVNDAKSSLIVKPLTAAVKDNPKGSAPKAATPLNAKVPERESLQNSSECAIKNETTSKAGKNTPSEVSPLSDSFEEEMLSVLEYEMDRMSSNEATEAKKTEGSSVIHSQSINLSGCAETQQRFLAQEALDCTKALLEDEHFSGQKVTITQGNSSLHNHPKPDGNAAEEQKGRGKRPVEDPNVNGQPPLKRRLLDEFDRTVDGPRGSTLQPEKSSPNGLIKDRRSFKYSVSLHPNITRPNRNGTNYLETSFQKTTPTERSTPAVSKAAQSKKPAFIPPFYKNAKTDTCKSTVLKDSVRTSSAFIPPFKKQRIVVQDNSLETKGEEEEDKLHCVSVTPFKVNSFVPPTTNTESAEDVTGYKSKEDIQTMALADTSNNKLVNYQNLSVGCSSEESDGETSCSLLTVPNIELARDMQDMRIRKKKRQTIRPLPGSLFLTKTSGVPRIPLKAAGNGETPARYTKKQLYSHGVHQHVYGITSETAEAFRFLLKQFVKRETLIDAGGVQLADGGWLIPSNDGTAGKEEFYRSLCDTPGVDPKLISEDWVYNHYRWIIWKQASMERSFPETTGGLCLTPQQVLLQLKYRYDVEVDHSRRPALRKIMERDDTAAKTLVLCVCGVASRGSSPKGKTPGTEAKVDSLPAVVWLTDGWYAIKTQLDEPLTAMLHKGRLAVGGKLIIHGAQLVGSQDACSPLEAPESLMLKICANSSRPARWDSKLGFHRDPRPFLLPVSSLYSNGGPVGCVDIVILRSYPIQWMERKPDGGVVFRSVRAEEREDRRYNINKQKAMEVLYAKIQSEFEEEERGKNKPQRRRRTISRQHIANLQDGEELYEVLGDDPAYLEAHLSVQQMETLHAHRRSLMEKKQAELQERYRRALQDAEDSEGSCPKRDVTPVWRLCITDSTQHPGSVYQLNLWRAPSDLQSLLKEGCRYKVYNLTTSDAKKPGGSTTLQLTGTKKTQFEDLQASQEWLSSRFQPRISTDFVALQNPEFQPLCGEVDLTGYVISIIDARGFSPAFYLADGNLNFIKVRCFSSFAQSGLEDVVRPRVLLALSNLQLRGQSTVPTPVVYAGDLTVFSTNPKEVHLQESLSQLRNVMQCQENFVQKAQEKLSYLIKSEGPSSISSPALQTGTPASKRDRRTDTKQVKFQQPVRNLGSFTPVGRKPPLASSPAEDAGSLKRRRALDYLSRIPSPPQVSLLNSAASPCVKKTFVPPRRSGTPCTLKPVQTPTHKPVSSPVEDEWVNDEELAMIDTQALLVADPVEAHEAV